MKYRKDLHNKDWFLNDPRSRKWIVQCSRCLEYGIKPETPDNVPKAKLKDNFPIMILNEDGFCEICSKFHSKKFS